MFFFITWIFLRQDWRDLGHDWRGTWGLVPYIPDAVADGNHHELLVGIALRASQKASPDLQVGGD